MFEQEVRSKAQKAGQAARVLAGLSAGEKNSQFPISNSRS